MSSASKVFLGYDHKGTHLATEIAILLEANGLPCWIAPRDLNNDATANAQVDYQIHRSRTHVYVIGDMLIDDENSAILNQIRRSLESRAKLAIVYASDQPLIFGELGHELYRRSICVPGKLSKSLCNDIISAVRSALPTGVFLSYRRGETSRLACGIYEYLSTHIGADVFLDVDTLHPGVQFRKEISYYIDRCAAVIVLIGPDWHRRRSWFTRREDYVHTEVDVALKSGALVLPVIADGCTMPDRRKAPKAIWPMWEINALQLNGVDSDGAGELIRSAITMNCPLVGRGS